MLYSTYLHISFPRYFIHSNTVNLNSEFNMYITVNSKYLLHTMSVLFAHYNTQYKSLIDLFGIDYLEKSLRFQVLYNLISYSTYNRIHIKVWTNELIPIPSVTSIYPAANWYERECWDLYGVFFKNHGDLRRLLTDYGFQGHPFRKDFPLSGFTELRYDARFQRISYEPIKSIQEFRFFDSLTPWEFYINK